MFTDKEKKLIKRFKLAEKRRSTWEIVWRDCFDYTMPGRGGFGTRVEGDRGDDLIFDDTAVVGVPEFASRMISGMTPGGTRFAPIEAAPGMLKDLEGDEQRQIKEDLSDVTEFVFEAINNSNYQTEGHETFQDLGVGTGNMIIDEGDLTEPLRFSSVPMAEVYLEAGPGGAVDGRYRKRRVKARDIMATWPKATLNDDLRKCVEDKPEKDLTFIECTVRDRSNDSVEAYDHCVLFEKGSHMLHQDRWEGSGSCPWITARWSKTAGEVYGRGPIFNALASIKTANLVVQLVLENGEMGIAGMWQADDDGVINPHNIRLVPGTVIPRAVGSTGLSPLQPPGNFDVSQLILKDMRHNINKALYNDTLGRREGTPMSATETAERMAEMSRVLGSPFARLKTEYVDQIIKRVVYILKKQGKIELPVINGTEIRIRATSPMIRAQRNEDIKQHINFAQVANEILGPQQFQTSVKGHEFVEQLADWYEVSTDLIRPQDE